MKTTDSDYKDFKTTIDKLHTAFADMATRVSEPLPKHRFDNVLKVD